MLSATEIVMKRNGLSEDESDYYVRLAGARVKSFLNLNSDDSLEQYLFAVVDIATLMYQQDVSIRNAKETLGLNSYSVSEGGISKSQTSASGADIRTTYETEINDILSGLNGKVRFL